MRALIAIAALLAAAPALAEPIVGVASVVDGDTIEILGQRIRLNGIDAPESRQRGAAGHVGRLICPAVGVAQGPRGGPAHKRGHAPLICFDTTMAQE